MLAMSVLICSEMSAEFSSMTLSFFP